MSPELHERVMNRASRLWHECGRPHGRYREFWEEARRELQIEDEQIAPDPMDELATWAPARPQPRWRPSRLRRLANSTERSLRRVIEKL